MRSIFSILTVTTCGEACWNAREEICRCECAGKNHGCLRVAGEAQPVRSAKHAGYAYELHAVGSYSDLYKAAEELNNAKGWRDIDARMPEYRYHYRHRETEDGSPARLKTATQAQCEKWSELAAWRDTSNGRPYLLWKLRDQPQEQYCTDQCDQCAKHRAEWHKAIPAPAQPPSEPAQDQQLTFSLAA